MQLERAIECRREYEILIDAVVNAHKGVMQPQLITPAQIFEQVKLSHDDMPSDLSLPVPTSATYQYLLLRIVSIDVSTGCFSCICNPSTADKQRVL